MNSQFVMENLSTLLPLLSGLAGALFTFYLMKKTKRQEWVAEVNKQLIQKRLIAYEEIIAITKGAAAGGGENMDGHWVKYPLALTDEQYYSDWSLNFKLKSTQLSHLIDPNLSTKLTTFNNYLAYLEQSLGHWDAPGEHKPIDPERFKRIGVLVYDDFKSLTDEILRAASDFYSRTIYDESFVPAALTHGEFFTLPSDFSELALFKNNDKILLLAKGDS